MSATRNRADDPNRATFDLAFVSTELRPFTETSSGAVFCDALSRVLSERGHRIGLFLPDGSEWQRHDTPGVRFGPLVAVQYEWGGVGREATIRTCELEASDARLFLVGLPGVDDVDLGGGPLGDENPETLKVFRSFEFCLAILLGLPKLGWTPDIFHLSDWEAAPITILLRESPVVQHALGLAAATISTVFSVHHLEDQGICPQGVLKGSDLRTELFLPVAPLEYYGKLNVLKAGLSFADWICTASPTYARDVQENRARGFGMEGLLRDRRRTSTGILYGIDAEGWNPVNDALLPYTYGPDDQHLGRANNKIRLLESLELPVEPDVPLFTFLSPLAEGQGLDLLQTVVGDLMGERLKVALLGPGDGEWTAFADELAAAFPDKVVSLREVSEPLFHLALAGSDFLLQLPREAVSGQLALRSLRYGAVPIVTPTGGLVDIVRPYSLETAKGEGFVLADQSGGALLEQISRGLKAHQKRIAWKRLVAQNMRLDLSWVRRSTEYEAVYRRLRESR